MSGQATAMICGVSGLDGAYLARLLLDKGYRVIGTSRDATTNSFANLERLGIADRVEMDEGLKRPSDIAFGQDDVGRGRPRPRLDGRISDERHRQGHGRFRESVA